jgi:putative oxidoreductase
MTMDSTRNTDRALLILRLAVGLVFIAHGCAKLFVMGVPGVTGFFTKLGIPLPGVAAWGVSLLEFAGGIALAVGLFTRPIALLFVVNMLVAIALVVFPKGFVGGYEFEFLLAAGSLAIALAGPGALSIDARLGTRGK